MIKIGIDISPLSSAHRFRGVGFYTKRLLESLKELSGKGAHQDIKVEELVFFKKCYQLPAASCQLLHIPYFDPFFLTLPLIKKTPIVVTVHDLIPIKYPAHFTKGIRGLLKWQIQKRLLKGAQAIITDSKYWREEISKIINYPIQKIYPIPLAGGDEFRVIKNASFLEKIRKKYRLPKNFVLYVGDLNWNKNVSGLIKALSNCKVKTVRLVLVGKAFLEETPEVEEINKLIKKLKLENRIIKLGFIPTKDLVAIYNLAKVYCQPSFAEGFGLPVLESMACGCPVVCSFSSSLPEIVGKSAILVNPRKSEEITRAINKVNSDVKIWKNIIEKGLVQAKKFSWEKTARMTLGVYQKVLNTLRSF